MTHIVKGCMLYNIYTKYVTTLLHNDVSTKYIQQCMSGEMFVELFATHTVRQTTNQTYTCWSKLNSYLVNITLSAAWAHSDGRETLKLTVRLSLENKNNKANKPY